MSIKTRIMLFMAAIGATLLSLALAALMTLSSIGQAMALSPPAAHSLGTAAFIAALGFIVLTAVIRRSLSRR